MNCDALLSSLSDPASRAVMEDWHEEHGGWSPGGWLLRIGLSQVAYAYAYADAYAYAYAYADAYAYANAYAYAYADAYAYAYADAHADAYAYANAYADAHADYDADKPDYISAFPGGKHVKQGFYFWAQQSANVVVLRLGWVRRIQGDEYEAINMVTPLRNGDYETLFADLAIDGPPKKWKFSRPMPRPSPLNRFHILGPISLDPDQWAKVCPRPKDWRDE